MVHLIVVDSNVWLFAEIEGPEHLVATEKLEQHLADGVAVNVIIFSEVFHKLSVLYGTAVTRGRVETILRNPGVEWLDISRDQSEKAARIAEERSLRINDALIAQQAMDLKLPVLTDNIKDFSKLSGLEVLPLRE